MVERPDRQPRRLPARGVAGRAGRDRPAAHRVSVVRAVVAAELGGGVLRHPAGLLGGDQARVSHSVRDGMASAKAAKEGFEVSGWVDTLGGLISRHQRFWIRLGDLETRMIADDLSGIPIEAPIYVSGLARSGSTILLEALARHEHTATHRYKDYPPVFTPYFWNWF